MAPPPPPPVEEPKLPQVLAARTGENLPSDAKSFRDAFVLEYIKDFNATAALMRLGVGNVANTQHIRNKACQLRREPYVSARIDELLKQLKPTDIVSRNQVLAALWKEANDEDNPGKTRVSALAHLANVLGMTRQKEDTNPQPVGVMVIPMTPQDDWATIAANSQKALKQGITIDGALSVVAA